MQQYCVHCRFTLQIGHRHELTITSKRFPTRIQTSTYSPSHLLTNFEAHMDLKIESSTHQQYGSGRSARMDLELWASRRLQKSCGIILNNLITALGSSNNPTSPLTRSSKWNLNPNPNQCPGRSGQIDLKLYPRCQDGSKKPWYTSHQFKTVLEPRATPNNQQTLTSKSNLKATSNKSWSKCSNRLGSIPKASRRPQRGGINSIGSKPFLDPTKP